VAFVSLWDTNHAQNYAGHSIKNINPDLILLNTKNRSMTKDNKARPGNEKNIAPKKDKYNRITIMIRYCFIESF
jgi:hypothetical protein